jgi:hypothetical protein
MNTLEKIAPAPGITVYTDKNGVTREYREVKRRAKVGDLVKVVDNTHVDSHRYAKGTVGYVNDFDSSENRVNVVTDTDSWGWLLAHDDYVVLEPTDIIHYNGKRYREVQRVAKEGELVIITGDHVSHGYPIGSIHLVHRADEDGVWDAGTEHMALCDNYGEWDYLVLEPLDTDTQPSQPQSNIESRLAALEQRVAELERRLQIREIANSVMDRNEAAFQKLVDSYTRAEVIELAKRDVENRIDGDGYFNLRIDNEIVGTYTTRKCEFVVNRQKRTVVALIVDTSNSKVIRRGIAKCAPGDCFNIHIGKAIALRRALGLDVPDYYVNAPQPTEAQVGDVVRFYWSKDKYEDHVIVGRWDDEHPNRFVVRGEEDGYWPFDPEDGDVILDDSHDFGGDAA